MANVPMSEVAPPKHHGEVHVVERLGQLRPDRSGGDEQEERARDRRSERHPRRVSHRRRRRALTAP